MTRPAAVTFFALYLIVLFVLTLGLFRAPTLGPSSRLNLVPFVGVFQYLRQGGRGMVINVLGNLGVFVPVGLLLPLLTARAASAFRVGLCGFLLSLGIETLQYLSRQRTADIDDVLLNTIGTLLGYCALAAWRSRSRIAKVSLPGRPPGV